MMDETKKSLEKLGINEIHDDYISKKRFEEFEDFFLMKTKRNLQNETFCDLDRHSSFGL